LLILPSRDYLKRSQGSANVGSNETLAGQRLFRLALRKVILAVTAGIDYSFGILRI